MQRKIWHSIHDECRCAEISEVTFDLLDVSDDVLDDGDKDGFDDEFDGGDVGFDVGFDVNNDGDDVGGCQLPKFRQYGVQLNAQIGAFNFLDIVRENKDFE